MRSLTPMPSGFVRPRRAGPTFAQLPGPARSFVEGIAALGGETFRLARSVTREIVRRHEQARMVHTLSHLSDHALKDIGLERNTIRSAAMDIQRGVDPRR